jgi:GMC oxidoreductase
MTTRFKAFCGFIFVSPRILRRVWWLYFKSSVCFSWVRLKHIGVASSAAPTRELGNSAPDHRAHDVPNLFLVDGSSLVTCGRQQPTATIQALAYRAAERIGKMAGNREI